MGLLDDARAFRKKITTVSDTADDQVAVQNKDIYEPWRPGKKYETNNIRRHIEKLYKCKQAHTSQEDWTPDQTPSLWDVINVDHAGTIEDPIPYDQSMEVFKDKYYNENGIIYLCIRDSGQPLYASCAALVGNYFEIVEA